MTATDQIRAIALRLGDEHRCHTVLLYGSHARGDATPQSDLDIACVRADGATTRDARLLDGLYLDAFIYNEAALQTPDELLLRLLGGVLVRDDHGFGADLLRRLQAYHDAGPPPLPQSERNARVLWAHKTLERARAGDPEAHYRRAFLLTQALEDQFVLRGRWFLGSKQAFAWLRAHEPPTHDRFVQALHPAATMDDVAELVARVYDLPATAREGFTRST